MQIKLETNLWRSPHVHYNAAHTRASGRVLFPVQGSLNNQD
jgi:hypothetical protein